MIRLLPAVAVAVLAAALCPASAAQPAAFRGISGVWVVEDGEAHVEVRACGTEWCGVTVWLREPLTENGEPKTDYLNPDETRRQDRMLGLELLRVREEPTHKDGRRVWQGNVYDPDSGKTYRCTVKLESDGRLYIRGFVGISLFGRTTHWSRADPRHATDG